MRWGINLRGDLAKLDDAEIASRFETLMAEREVVHDDVVNINKWLYQRGWGAWFGRGPLHARIFYNYLGLQYYDPFKKPSLYDLYLLDCELKDLRDEIKSRVARKKAIPVT